MEVEQAQLDLIQGSDALTKAKVAVHGFHPDNVAKEVASGLAVTKKTYKAGTEALGERNDRRFGLSISLLVDGSNPDRAAALDSRHRELIDQAIPE